MRLAPAPVQMKTFQWQGAIHPLPPGFEGLGVEAWFVRLARIWERVGVARQLHLPLMWDAFGNELDAEDVILIKEFGFHARAHFEAFAEWSAHAWAHHLGEDVASLSARMGEQARQALRRPPGPSKPSEPAGAAQTREEIEGVSRETWAAIRAAAARGESVQRLCAQAAISPEKWRRVDAGWRARASIRWNPPLQSAMMNPQPPHETP